MTLFKTVETMMNDILAHVSPGLITKFMNDLEPLASAGLGIYLLWLLVPLLLNSDRVSAQDVMIKVVVWTIVFAFAFNSGNLLTEVNSAVDTFYSWASGSNTIYKTLDDSFDKIISISDYLFNKDDADYVAIEGGIALVMVLGSYYVFAFITVAFLIVSEIILHMLLLALPLAILAIIFPMIKSMFANWLQLFIDNILTVLFLNIIFNIVEGQFNQFSAKAESIAKDPTSGSLVSVGFGVSIIIAFLMLFIIIGRLMASRLSSASMSAETMAAIPKFRK